MKKTQSISVLAAVAVLAAAGITSWGQPSEPFVNYRWTAPDSGTVAIGYIIKGEIDGIAFVFPDTARDTTFSFPYQYGKTIRIKVAGIDSLNREGPFSSWSELWIDHGPPSQPSQPLQTLELR